MSNKISNIVAEIRSAYYAKIGENEDDSNLCEFVPELSYQETFQSKNGYSAVLAEEFGGEGMGDTMYYVLKISHPEKEDRYARIVGSYDSYEGSYFDGESWVEVWPKEVTVVKYFDKNGR